MSRDTRTRRLTRPDSGSGTAKARAATDTSIRPLVSRLAGTGGLTDVLPHLHQHALDVTGGSCSLLFEHNPRNGVMQATSAFGLDELRTDPWTPGARESDVVNGAFTRSLPTFVADIDRQLPDLAARLGTPSALLLPLVQNEHRVGLLAVGFATPPESSPGGTPPKSPMRS